MAVVRKKQDDKHLKTLREIVSLGGNKQCFDCGQRGPTYVNMTIGSFVCTRCSGLLRGITPPHRVKSISMATFSSDEIEFIRSHGNDTCAKTWLGLWDPKRILTQDQRDLMVDKYERKRYFLEPASPLKSLPQHTNNANNGNLINGLGSSAAYNHGTPPALTPPASLRLNSSRHPGAAGKTNGSTTATTMTSTTHQFQTQFTPDDQPAGMFATKVNASNNNNNHNNNNSSISLSQNSPSFNGKSHSLSSSKHSSPANSSATVARHGMSGLSGSQATNGDRTAARLSGPPPTASNGNSTSSSSSSTGISNKFTPDGDFGTDFEAASGLFATVKVNGVQRTNGAANANADFADFEHNAIFNAADSQWANTTPPKSAQAQFVNTNTINQANISNSCSNSNYNSSNYSSSNSSFAQMQSAGGSNQWNLWQQFQLPYVVPPEQNRWSLPMSLSSTSAGSLNSSGSTPFNSSSSSINSTPPVDRYAALKDLDMQLREVVKDTGLFSTSTGSTAGNATGGPANAANNGHNSGVHNGAGAGVGAGAGGTPAHLVNGNVEANPFKAANPFQMPAAAQANGNASGTAGWATDFGSAPFANGAQTAAGLMQHQQQLLMQQQQQQQQQQQMLQASMFGNGNNGNVAGGYGMAPANGYHPAMQATGFGVMQRNPFAATTTGGAAIRSNNPFL